MRLPLKERNKEPPLLECMLIADGKGGGGGVPEVPSPGFPKSGAGEYGATL